MNLQQEPPDNTKTFGEKKEQAAHLSSRLNCFFIQTFYIHIYLPDERAFVVFGNEECKGVVESSLSERFKTMRNKPPQFITMNVAQPWEELAKIGSAPQGNIK